MINSLKKVLAQSMLLRNWVVVVIGGGLMMLNASYSQTVPRDVSAGQVMFVAGSAEHQSQTGAKQSILKDMKLVQGDTIHTSNNAYVYVRMADAGLLVIRPQSQLRIDRWHYDPLHPELSEIKYTLQSGVARYVSGRGSQAAKDKFRFNTSLAAIGVRGTDFSVLARSDLTQVSVRSGAVVVSGLGPGCTVETLGPCEGSGSIELLATHRDKLLQISLEDRRPQLIDIAVGGGPDRVRKPAPNEPRADAAPSSVTKDVLVAEFTRDTTLANASAPGQATGDSKPPISDSSKLPVPIAIWGRWGALPNDSGTGVVQEVLKDRGLISINKYYVLGANAVAPVELPGAGSGRFSLVSHNGILIHPETGVVHDTTVTDSNLQINFDTRRFQTSLQLQAAGLQTTFQSQGSVESNGKMTSDPYVSTTAIDGLVGGKGGAEAIYIYRRPTDHGIEVSGAASWRK